ncbi:putative C2orf65 [Gossypium arboreum]|uniref:Putative C2orf65 n=1 Tax=Gossypium arboreum TaxID=29729 RepID=A0A0B0MH42_GOSAR|nr:putative C2orf65 [Gossypium arboreum]
MLAVVKLKLELEANASFKVLTSNLAGSVKQISCNLSASVNHIIDGFNPCKSSMKLQQASSPVNFNIIDRTNLGSLSEGLIFGNPYFVTPSASPEIEAASDEMDQLELNAQVFKGLCSALHSMDQGLICSSNCNVETMREATFNCYYILQPSDNGPMLLRRLAGSEEVLPFSDVNRFVAHSVPKEIEISIQCVAPKRNDATCEPNPTNPDSTEVNARPISSVGVMVVYDEMSQLDQTAEERKKPTSIAEEWERLVANEVPVKYSPTKPKSGQSVILLSSPDNSKQLDINTTRILERLELPRQLKSKQGSPGNNSSRILDVANMSMKKPLITFQPNQAADQGVTSSQLIRPSFQRLKRKHK